MTFSLNFVYRLTGLRSNGYPAHVYKKVLKNGKKCRYLWIIYTRSNCNGSSHTRRKWLNYRQIPVNTSTKFSKLTHYLGRIYYTRTLLVRHARDLSCLCRSENKWHCLKSGAQNNRLLELSSTVCIVQLMN